jgi:hypothetical protein
LALKVLRVFRAFPVLLGLMELKVLLVQLALREQ